MDLKKYFEGEKIREKLIPILVGLTILVLTLGFGRNTLINLVKLSVENRKQQEKWAGLKRKAQLLQSLDEEEVEVRSQKLEEVFPSKKPVLNLIASLVQLAREEGVAFSGVQLNPGKVQQLQPESTREIQEREEEESSIETEEKLEEFIISFEIEGEMEAITSFITQLENTAPLMRIETLDLGLEGPSASLAVRVFYQALPESLGPIDQEVPLLTYTEKEILEEIASYRKAEIVQATAPVGKENLFSLP